VGLLPHADSRALLDLRTDAGRDEALQPVQLLEGHEYKYQVELEHPTAISFTVPEIFYPDDDTQLTGRLRPGLYTGSLEVGVFAEGKLLGSVAFEVRSQKLDYYSHYQWMLRDIAEYFAELIMQRFGPTSQSFEPDQARDAQTLYQRFAFLKSLISPESLDAAIQQILHRPHRRWLTQDEPRVPGQQLPGGSRVYRQITGPGPRIRWLGGPEGVKSLPATIHVPKHHVSLDTPENRFVKFALTHWRDIMARIRAALLHESPHSPVTRGLREVDSLLRVRFCRSEKAIVTSSGPTFSSNWLLASRGLAAMTSIRRASAMLPRSTSTGRFSTWPKQS